MVQTHLHRSIPRLCGYWEQGTKTSVLVFVFPDKVDKMSAQERRAFKFEMLEKGAASNMDGSVVVPACMDCLSDHFCRAVRLNHCTFELSPSQKKKLQEFRENCSITVSKPAYDPSILMLYKNYIQNRHGDTNTAMKNHTAEDLKHMMAASEWMVVGKDRKSGKIVSFALIDQYEKSFNLEYLAYDLSQMKLSPGLSTILAAGNMLKFAYPDGYMYLGSWSPGSRKLGYKNQFIGLEIRSVKGWRELPRNTEPQDAPRPPPLSVFSEPSAL